MEIFKPVYNMTPEEITETKRVAIEKQNALLEKMKARRPETEAMAVNNEKPFIVTPLMRKEAEAREQALKASLPDKE